METRAEAPAKIILLGEHAVVYDKPGIAIPVKGLKAHAMVEPSKSTAIKAPDLGEEYTLEDNSALVQTVKMMQKECENNDPIVVTITSDIPIASGLGSGVAVTVAMIRAIAEYYCRELGIERVNELAYEIEKIYHGTPSGIDNTTVVYEKPIFFKKSQGASPFDVKGKFVFVIADTKIRSKTKETVADVRKGWLTDPNKYNSMFDEIGDIAEEGKQALAQGNKKQLGELMTKNHKLLKEMGVSCKELDELVNKAIGAGALGAKMSGGGRGGNMIALVKKEDEDRVVKALGNVIITEL